MTEYGFSEAAGLGMHFFRKYTVNESGFIEKFLNFRSSYLSVSFGAATFYVTINSFMTEVPII